MLTTNVRFYYFCRKEFNKCRKYGLCGIVDKKLQKIEKKLDKKVSTAKVYY